MFSHTSPPFGSRRHGGCHTSAAAQPPTDSSTPPHLQPNHVHGGLHNNKRTLCELYSTVVTSSTMEVDAGTPNSLLQCQQKKRRTGVRLSEAFGGGNGGLLAYLPTLEAADYYMQPSLEELAARECVEPGYCSRVLDFMVGRFGYGAVKYPGETDVRGLDLDKIVKFRRHEVIVYEDESGKPLVGERLNKPAEVTLMIQTRLSYVDQKQKDNIVKILRQSVEEQGAHFVSFNPENGEWKFFVNHFSRFGLSEEDEEDMMMEDTDVAEDPPELNHEEMSEADEGNLMDPAGIVLSHSLPAHLGLDPIKMQEMRMLMFSDMDEEAEDFKELPTQYNPSFGKEYSRSPLQNDQRISYRSTPPAVRKTPLALLEYKHGSFDSNSPGAILMAQENKSLPLKTATEGFKLDLSKETPVTRKDSRNIVDAGLLMGRSFRVGWGPNGVLVHAGTPIGGNGSQKVLSSVINIEKVAIDNVVRDEKNKVRPELVETAITSPLELHKELFHETKEVDVGSFNLRLQKLVSNRFMLSDVCRSYVDIIERQLEVPGLSSSACLVFSFTHQIMIWELIKVLFSERENGVKLESYGADDEEEMVQDEKPPSQETDPEAFPLIRRAEFSYWLQENVHHRVEEIISLNKSNYLESILLLLSARQLDEAVELASSEGDVRLACLLSQSGGSMVNRSDIGQQLELWRINGLDFSFIEKDRIRLYELLAGDVHGAFQNIKVDWKRFLGLLMWYHLAPNTPLPVVFRTYQDLLYENNAPYPVPVYIDGHVLETVPPTTEKRYDLSYYLMMLHGSEDGEVDFLKTMFSALSSTYDPLDYHMIWHQRAVLEAVGVISASDLHVLDMSFVSQLLCLGQCHWAIYVVLHMSRCEDFPYLHANLIREILFQYCDSWSSQISQRQFIEDLGIPKAWLHEAMAVYFNYYGDLPKALEHFIECENWQKAHSIFVTSVAHTLFLSAKHSEIWRLATSMEDHKSEIENWDLGAGIYISFYLTRSSLADDAMNELDSVESKNAASREFLGQLNQSLAVWGARLPMDVRVVYSKMADEICNLLLSDISEGPTRDVQLSCFDTVFSAPIPQDLRSNHLQDAVSLFTCFLSEVAT